MNQSLDDASKLGAALHTLPTPVYIVDEGGRYVDRVGQDTASGNFVGQRLHDVLPRQVADSLLGYIEQALTKNELQVATYRLPPSDLQGSIASPQWFEARIAPVTGDGAARCVALLTLEITGRGDTVDEAPGSGIDPLTGVRDQTHFMRALEHEVTRQSRYREPFCLLLLELDHYDTICERYGSEAGAAAIRELSRLIRQELRFSDILGRLEEAEFGVVLVNTPLKWGLEVGERIRIRTARTPFSLPRKTVQLTVSGGVAEFNSEDTSSSLLWRAEEALFKSGEKSENRISVG